MSIICNDIQVHQLCISTFGKSFGLTLMLLLWMSILTVYFIKYLVRNFVVFILQLLMQVINQFLHYSNCLELLDSVLEMTLIDLS